MRVHRLAALAVLTAVALFTPRAELRAQADVIRGRITGPDSLPIERATVTVTTLSGNVTRAARTAKDGRYTVTFANADGDYWVSVAALGYATTRFEIKRIGDEQILIADARLQT